MQEQRDSTSGIAGYYFYVDGELKNSENKYKWNI